jgi:hypothetical protein
MAQLASFEALVSSRCCSSMYGCIFFEAMPTTMVQIGIVERHTNANFHEMVRAKIIDAVAAVIFSTV